MPAYTVTCRKTAQDELAFFWLHAGNKRASVTTASHAIDQALRRDPFQGPKRGSYYHFSSGPLTAVYEVLQQDLTVVIIQYLYHG